MAGPPIARGSVTGIAGQPLSSRGTGDFSGQIMYDSEYSIIGLRNGQSGQGESMIFYAFYGIAAVIMILHFTGWLRRNNLEWLVLVLAVAVFPVVIFLR